MQIGYVGLGKMGFNMVLRLLEKNHEIVVFNRSEDSIKRAVHKGAIGAESLSDMAKKLSSPKVIWLMVPHKAVEDVLAKIMPSLSAGDIVIDGGNSFYKESMVRAKVLGEKDVEYLDVGVSGGPAGAKNGASLMIGGKKEVFEKLKSLFLDLAIQDGYAYMGKSGAGHFVKMVHNGIEYGMMQAIAEGFDILRQSEFDLDLKQVIKPYANGSVIESRLISWLSTAFEKYGQNLDVISGTAKHSGEGAWTVDTAHDKGINDKVIHEALRARELSKEKPGYQGKVVSALRGEFGNHPVLKYRKK